MMAEDDLSPALLYQRAEALVPVLRARAREAEQARRVQDQTIKDAQSADLLRMMVPFQFGGLGMGATELCEVSRILAKGDASAAWVISFLIEHNWLACRLPLTAQERLYADARHVNTASTLQPNGLARRVEGGFLVTGRWSYASAIHHSPWTFVNARIEGDASRAAWVMLLPVDAVTVIDDWQMSGMAATGSASFEADGVFVPSDMAIEMDRLHSATDHPGAGHSDPVYRLPVLPVAAAMLASFSLGAAQGAMEIALSRLTALKASGHRAIDQDSTKLRWAEAHQLIRAADLILRDLLARIEHKGDTPWTNHENGQIELDRVTIVHDCKTAILLIMEGLGSSAWKIDDPLQRIMRDVQVLANHIAHTKDAGYIKGAVLNFSARMDDYP